MRKCDYCGRTYNRHEACGLPAGLCTLGCAECYIENLERENESLKKEVLDLEQQLFIVDSPLDTIRDHFPRNTLLGDKI